MLEKVTLLHYSQGGGTRLAMKGAGRKRVGSGKQPKERLTARLAAAGAMLPELYATAEVIGESPTPARLREAILHENVLARSSLPARVKVYQKLQQRYFPPSSPDEWPLLVRALSREEKSDQKALVTYVALCAYDPLFRTLNLRWLVPQLNDVGREIEVAEVLQAVEVLERSHPEVKRWGESTRLSLAQHYLSALRDFGFARGGARKRLARPHVGAHVMLFVCELLLGREVPPRDVLQHDLVRVLGLDLNGAIEALNELDRLGMVHFRSQGGVVNLYLLKEEGHR